MEAGRDYRWSCYGISCPDTGRIVYVGLSCNVVARIKQHKRCAKRGDSTPLYCWMRTLLERGDKFGVLILDRGVGIESASIVEQQWIDRLKDEYLLNRNPGGEVLRNRAAFEKSLVYDESNSVVRAKRVRCLTTGQVFASMSECARILGVDQSRIYQSATKGWRCLGRKLVWESS